MLAVSCFFTTFVFRGSCECLTGRVINIFSIDYFSIAKQCFVKIEMLRKRSISIPLSIPLKNKSSNLKKKGGGGQNGSSSAQVLSDRKEYTQVLPCSIVVLIVNFIQLFYRPSFQT